MPTNLSIDPDLIERAFQVSGESTREAAVAKALEEFISRREREASDMPRNLEWDTSYNYKRERSR